MSAPTGFRTVYFRDLVLGPVIGRGGFSVVHSSTFDGRPVAVKEFRAPETAPTFDLAAYIGREIAALSALDHPNIVSCVAIALAADSGEPCGIIMELASCDMEAYVRSVDAATVASHLGALSADALRGLAHLHAAGFLHRDVKPSNLLVFIPPDGGAPVCKVGDCGLAREVPVDVQGVALTRAGTVGFYAPEVLGGTAYDSKADMFSFGVSIRRIARSLMEAAGEAEEDEDPDADPALLLLRNSPTPALARLVTLCCSEEPALRPSAEFALEQLQGLSEWAALEITARSRLLTDHGLSLEALAAHFAAMDAHVASSAVQLQGWLALKLLATQADMAAALVRAGLFPRLLTAMAHHSDHQHIQETACTILFSVVRSSGAYKRQLIADGGLGHVYAALDAHRGSHTVQCQGCGVLMSCAEEGMETSDRLLADGCLVRVYAALEGHGEAEDVQAQACTTLWAMAQNSLAVKSAIIATGGMARLYAAMRRQMAASAWVQKSACGALWRCIWNHPEAHRIQEQVVNDGGLALILEAMRTHPASEPLHGQAVCALYVLTHDNPRTRLQLVEAGAVPLVVAAMRCHLDSNGVQEQACSTLRSLAEEARNRPVLVAEGVVPCVQAAQGKFLADKGIQRNAAFILTALGPGVE